MEVAPKRDWTPGDPDGPPLRGHGWATGLWMFGSSALCLFLLIWGLAALSSVDSPATASTPMEIDVTGQQWVWTFTYPAHGNIESDDLYLPVDRPVLFRVTSDDVIHSFWVPEMGIKVDANPGMTTTTQTIARPPRDVPREVRRAVWPPARRHGDLRSRGLEPGLRDLGRVSGGS